PSSTRWLAAHFLVAGGEPMPVFEAMDTALDDAARTETAWSKASGRASELGCTTRALIAALQNGVQDLSLLEHPATARLTAWQLAWLPVAPVSATGRS